MAARVKAVQTEPNLNVEQWPIDRVVMYARNPRKISDAAVAKVAASIKEYGFRQPIVVDKEGVIIVGHTRLAASQKLGLETVSVHVAADLTPQQAKAYRLTDNRTAEENDWATDLLALELTDLQEDGFDLDILGFDQEEIDALFENDTPDFPPASADEQGRLDEKKKVCCPECGHEFAP